eukprot:11676249-Alexandrium_andersonii.AAC.1
MGDPRNPNLSILHPPCPRKTLGTSRTAPVVVGFGISANSRAERTPRELRGSILRPLLGPR